MAAKLRPDSTFSRIPDELRDEVNAALLDGAHSYADVREILANAGVKLSIQQIGEYYRRHLLQEKWRTQEKTAAVLESCQAENVDAATHLAVKQATFELATAPQADPAAIAKMYSLLLKANQLDIDRRKLEMMEAREARLKETVTDNTMTTEEKQTRIRELFGLN